jgi:hypothetical protein
MIQSDYVPFSFLNLVLRVGLTQMKLRRSKEWKCYAAVQQAAGVGDRPGALEVVPSLILFIMLCKECFASHIEHHIAIMHAYVSMHLL